MIPLSLSLSFLFLRPWEEGKLANAVVSSDLSLSHDGVNLASINESLSLLETSTHEQSLLSPSIGILSFISSAFRTALCDSLLWVAAHRIRDPHGRTTPRRAELPSSHEKKPGFFSYKSHRSVGHRRKNSGTSEFPATDRGGDLRVHLGRPINPFVVSRNNDIRDRISTYATFTDRRRMISLSTGDMVT